MIQKTIADSNTDVHWASHVLSSFVTFGYLMEKERDCVMSLNIVCLQRRNRNLPFFTLFVAEQFLNTLYLQYFVRLRPGSNVELYMCRTQLIFGST